MPIPGMMDSVAFPYTPRTSQEQIMQHISKSLEGSGHAVIEAGTGTGKTICALTPALSHAFANKKKVLYLTRTNSQQTQVILELRQLGIYGLGVQGRGNMCPLAKEDEELGGGTSEELSIFCGERKKRVLRGEHKKNPKKSCRYFYNNTQLTDDKMNHIRQNAKDNLPTVEEFCSDMGGFGLCPYELNKELIKDASVVVAPYIYFFLGFIRHHLLDWMQWPLKDLVLIVDEAHNLPDYARELQTFEISRHSLGVVHFEAEEFGDPEVKDGLTVTGFCDIFRDILDNLSNEYVVDDDGFIPPNEMRTLLMSTLQCTSSKLNLAVKNIVAHGEVIKDKKRGQGRLPRSYIHSLGSFLAAWMGLESARHVKLVYGGDNPRIQAYCLDPSDGTRIINEAGGSVHMSGTLSPLDEYRDTMGLDPGRTNMHSYPSPFPEENRAVLYVDNVTTRYEELKRDESMVPRLGNYIKQISGLGKNAVVFFPSFRMLELVKKEAGRLECGMIQDGKGKGQQELMKLVQCFKDGGGILLSVAGGRVSEGMDFMGEQLQIVVIAGIPYPKPTAKQRALQNYFEVKFGKGWEYTVKTPATRKTLQAIGRLIRSETDIGVAVILDNRAVHFKDSLPEMRLSNDLVGDVKRFFSARSA
jgi:DNA excision repair protein ERCC-2